MSTILIDDREQRSGIVEIFHKLEINVEITRLSLGDYLVDHEVLFERKTIADFARSIIMDGYLNKSICWLNQNIDAH